jgi:hypothetical protein
MFMIPMPGNSPEERRLYVHTPSHTPLIMCECASWRFAFRIADILLASGRLTGITIHHLKQYVGKQHFLMCRLADRAVPRASLLWQGEMTPLVIDQVSAITLRLCHGTIERNGAIEEAWRLDFVYR